MEGKKGYMNNLQAELSQYLGDECSDDEIDVLSDGSVSLSDEESVDSNSWKQENFSENITSLCENLCKLTTEEKNVIDSCKDPVLKKALTLNRQKALQCQELIKKINIAEIEVVEKYKHAKAKRIIDKNKDSPKFFWKIGTPYFKDASKFTHSQNADYERKIANHELIYTHFNEGKRWIPEDQAVLHMAVCESYRTHRINTLSREIRIMKVQLGKAGTTLKIGPDKESLEQPHDLKNELSTLELQLRQLRREKELQPPPLYDSCGVDWHKISQFNLSGKHSVEECRAFWNIYLHPSINKKNWTSEENEKILKLVSKYKWQDWDSMALELGTNRTGFMVIVHYYSKLCDKFKRNKFTKQEDTKLLEIVEKCRIGPVIPWQSVSNYFEDRSKHQLYHRYQYYLSQDDIKKGLFTEAEDILILYLFEKFGRNFSKISTFVPNRTTIQVRNRYSNYLMKQDINFGNFSIEDDLKLLEFVKCNGLKKWVQIGRELNRGRSHVRQRYYTIKKWRQKNPNSPLESVPKRNLNVINRSYNQRINCMRAVLQMLKPKVKGVPTLRTIESYIKQYYKAKEDGEKMPVCNRAVKKGTNSTDSKLIQFFTSTCKIPKCAALPKNDRSIQSAQKVIKLLDLLEANTKLIIDKIDVDKILPKHQLDVKVLTLMKSSYQSISPKPNIFNQMTLPSTSAMDRDALEIPPVFVKEIIPPTISTCIGLRGFMIKSNQFKSTHKVYLSEIKNQFTSDEILIHNVPYDDNYMFICNQRKSFFNRLYAMFKWPSIISFEMPKEQLLKIDTVVEEIVDEILIPENNNDKGGHSGRPKKKKSNKIALMTEGRKRKHGANDAYPKIEEKPLTEKVCDVEKEVTYYPSRTRHAGYSRNAKLLDKRTSVESFAPLDELDETSEDDI